MNSILQQGSSVKASNRLGKNGGILGAVVGAVVGAAQTEQKIAIEKHLMDYQHGLGMERDQARTINNMTADIASQGLAHHYKTVQEAASAKNKIDLVKEEGSQKRQNTEHELNLGHEIMKKHTAALETAAGLPLSGGISALIAGPNLAQGQLQALKGHPHLGINPSADAANKTGSQGKGRKRQTVSKTPRNPGEGTGADASFGNRPSSTGSGVAPVWFSASENKSDEPVARTQKKVKEPRVSKPTIVNE
jgi:hypothetical protein